MKKPNTVSNETEALSDNVHRNSQWLEDSAYNVSSLVRKVLTKIMRMEIDFSAKVQGTKAF